MSTEHSSPCKRHCAGTARASARGRTSADPDAVFAALQVSDFLNSDRARDAARLEIARSLETTGSRGAEMWSGIQALAGDRPDDRGGFDRAVSALHAWRARSVGERLASAPPGRVREAVAAVGPADDEPPAHAADLIAAFAHPTPVSESLRCVRSLRLVCEPDARSDVWHYVRPDKLPSLESLYVDAAPVRDDYVTDDSTSSDGEGTENDTSHGAYAAVGTAEERAARLSAAYDCVARVAGQLVELDLVHGVSDRLKFGVYRGNEPLYTVTVLAALRDFAVHSGGELTRLRSLTATLVALEGASCRIAVEVLNAASCLTFLQLEMGDYGLDLADPEDLAGVRVAFDRVRGSLRKLHLSGARPEFVWAVPALTGVTDLTLEAEEVNQADYGENAFARALDAMRGLRCVRLMLPSNGSRPIVDLPPGALGELRDACVRMNFRDGLGPVVERATRLTALEVHNPREDPDAQAVAVAPSLRSLVMGEVESSWAERVSRGSVASQLTHLHMANIEGPKRPCVDAILANMSRLRSLRLSRRALDDDAAHALADGLSTALTSLTRLWAPETCGSDARARLMRGANALAERVGALRELVVACEWQIDALTPAEYAALRDAPAGLTRLHTLSDEQLVDTEMGRDVTRALAERKARISREERGL